MPTTDRRARLCCRECGAEIDAETAARNRRVGMTFCDACFATVPRAVREGWIIAHPKLTPTEIGIGMAIGLRYQQQRRAEKRARRLAIARRRQRIAAQPRVGDVLITRNYQRLVVDEIYGHCLFVTTGWTWLIGREFICRTRWRELVRRARVTQEAA